MTAPTNDNRRGIELRDAFFALCGASSGSPEADRYRAEITATDADPTVELDGLCLSFFPSDRFRAVRFLPAAQLPADVRPLFARPSSQMPELAAVFVDPEEFSFRTFENILPLDRWFADPLDLTMRKDKRLGDAKKAIGLAYVLEGGADSLARLARLDSLGLYLTPMNGKSRGGQRFIFHSDALGQSLTAAVRGALPKKWLKGFSHVNPIFRCNRFDPGDAPFRSHVDTPYYDAARQQISKYTLLIYLTGGEGESLLRIGDDVNLSTIDPNTCVIFPQHLEHAGAAFVDGRKVFLRTELVFTEANISHEPRIAQMFAKACYLTGESVLAPELSEHVHRLYDCAAAAHWGGGTGDSPYPDPLVAKRFRDVDFVSNGYDYWFSSDSLSLEECAALTILDALNCKVGGIAFRKLATAEVLAGDSPGSLAAEFLASRRRRDREPLFEELELGALFPPPEAVDADTCCSFHHMDTFEPGRDESTVEFFTAAQAFARLRIEGAPITMLGQEVFINPKSFVIADGQIHVRSVDSLETVNFAACFNDEYTPDGAVGVETTIEAQHVLVPPIRFSEEDGTYHLRFDFFRNSWIVRHEQLTVPVPRIEREWWESRRGWLEAFPGDFDEEQARRSWPDFGDDAVIGLIKDYI